MVVIGSGSQSPQNAENNNWAVLSDEQMRKIRPFSLLNDEQMSNKVGVKHQPDKLPRYALFNGNSSSHFNTFFFFQFFLLMTSTIEQIIDRTCKMGPYPSYSSSYKLGSHNSTYRVYNL